ncbi:antirestriction protein ArdR [Pseudomonas coleopterorum]|uniref:antirestriction protein ArdR n=1 Tax=Pseudomonas coleopterorum TaxID=1605838 RepID=UPI00177FDCF6|nr:antirestriction protein ArdR [Pseudomonas coleopterorum]MBD8483914.1 antirestriction protein ArdR [Pseudomonas coleopterorum]
MTQLIESVRATAAKWRAGNQEHRGGVVLVWEGDVYGWKNELRDPESERPGVYAVDKAGLVFKAEGGDDYNGAKAWVAVDPDPE